MGLAVSTADPRVLDRLDAARQVTGVSLLPQEEELLFSLSARRGR